MQKHAPRVQSAHSARVSVSAVCRDCCLLHNTTTDSASISCGGLGHAATVVLHNLVCSTMDVGNLAHLHGLLALVRHAVRVRQGHPVEVPACSRTGSQHQTDNLSTSTPSIDWVSLWQQMAVVRMARLAPGLLLPHTPNGLRVAPVCQCPVLPSEGLIACLPHLIGQATPPPGLTPGHWAVTATGGQVFGPYRVRAVLWDV
jgi:hypothetical protein